MKDRTSHAIQKLRKNDQNSFNQLFDLYHHKIYFFCLKNGLDTESSKEVVQEVFVKLWSSRSKIDPSSNVKSYIYTIAKNVMLDEFKRRIKQKAAIDYQIHMLPQNTIQDNVALAELQLLVAQILKSLPEKRRLVFEMSRYENFSNKEIAKEMGISVKTVEAQLTLALQRFREVFKRSEIIGFGALFLFSALL